MEEHNFYLDTTMIRAGGYRGARVTGKFHMRFNSPLSWAQQQNIFISGDVTRETRTGITRATYSQCGLWTRAYFIPTKR